MSKWAEADGWVYEVFEKNTPASELRQFQSFKQLWDSKRTGNDLPAWRDSKFEEFAEWYGWLVVEDIIPGPTYDSVFRLWGTNVTTLFGADLTGKRRAHTNLGRRPRAAGIPAHPWAQRAGIFL